MRFWVFLAAPDDENWALVSIELSAIAGVARDVAEDGFSIGFPMIEKAVLGIICEDYPLKKDRLDASLPRE